MTVLFRSCLGIRQLRGLSSTPFGSFFTSSFIKINPDFVND